jgi:hypothetical protein
MAYTAGFSVSVGDPTKASDVTTLAANDDYLKAAVDGKAALSGSTNNTVATVTGANALIGEADLTFAANKLTVFGTTGTGAATASVLNLSTRETTVVDADQLGRIEFQAPAETGSDAVLVAASIYAEADVTFDATNNATDLVLATAHDGAAAERVRITSQGEIGLAGANYGTDGQVLTSAGAGAAAAWEAIPPGTTLSGSTNNTVATVTGANALIGEANLTFDGTTLAIGNGATADYLALRLYQGGGTTYYWDFTADVDAGDLIIGSNHASFSLILNPTGGNVGIGTTDPDAAAPTGSSSPRILKVDGGAGVDAAIQIVGHDNNHGLDLWTDVSTGDAYIDQRGDHANYDMRFRTRTTGTPVDAMTISGLGNVGIGTAAPATIFHVSGAFNNAGSPKITSTGTEAGLQLDANSTNGTLWQILSVGASGGGGVGNFQLYNSTDSLTAMTINPAGYLMVGQAAADSSAVGAMLFPNGQMFGTTNGNPVAYFNRQSSTGTALVFRYNNSDVGTISVAASSTAYNTSSDYRLKENVVDLTGATTRVAQLQPHRFNFIRDPDTTVDGFVAHEVSDIVPEAITGTKDETRDAENVIVNAGGAILVEDKTEAEWVAGKEPTLVSEATDEEAAVYADPIYAADTVWHESLTVPEYQGIDQAKLVPLLTAAIQELTARITALESA